MQKIDYSFARLMPTQKDGLSNTSLMKQDNLIIVSAYMTSEKHHTKVYRFIKNDVIVLD